jgi:DNA-binding transcriptional LysR family regulator
MRLRQIEVFHAIYTTGSMTNAASVLNVSQPSISKVLAHAEQQLGYRLFDRVKGKLIPTPEAHQLFVHVGAVYRDVDRLRQVAANIKAGQAGRIRVACTPALGLEVLPQAVASFQREHANTVFEIETLHLDEISDALLESRMDLGVAFDPVGIPGIRQRQLARGRFVVLAPADETFDGKTELTVDDLRDRPFIALNSRGPLGRALSEYLGDHGAELNIVAWTETYYVARELVARGVGITPTTSPRARAATRRYAVSPSSRR